jgi:PAS domain S-box-containing protein
VIVFPGAKSSEDRRILQLARNLSVAIGSEFFNAIAKHMMRELGTDCIHIGEFAGGQLETVRAIAAYVNGEPDHTDYPLAGSAAARIMLGKTCVVRSGAQARFPSDELAVKVKASALVAAPLTNSNGRPIGVITALFSRSVSHLGLVKLMLELFAPRASAELSRLQKERQLRESEERYRVFVERNSDAMWRIEFEQPIPTTLPELEQLNRIYEYGYVAECNDALARLVGLGKAEQLIGSRIEMLSPRAEPSSEKALLKAIRSEYRFSTVETTPPDRDGKRRYMLRTQWGIIEGGMLQRLWGSTRDITILKHSERALNASEQRMADLLDSVHLAVVMLNSSGAIALCNDYFFRLTGWEAAQLIGQDWLDRLVPAEESARLRAAFARSVAGSQVPLHFESTLLGPDGRRWWISWDSTFLLDSDGRVDAVVNVGRDITEQKLLETQLRQAQKLESIGRLASGIAHDFNNLLTIVLGYSDTLLQGRDPSDSAYAGLWEIRRAAERGAELTHQLLAFSRRQVLRPEVLNLNKIVVDLQRMLQRVLSEQIKLTIDLDPALGLTRADAGQIHQVLLNLSLNARDAMPSGGDLTIRSSNLDVEETANSSLFALPAGRYIQLVVVDTGSGMSEEVQSHLFEPFFTTKDPGKGTGLGLSTAYGIVRQSGGHIVVESALNKGTCVRVFLPRIGPVSEPGPRSGPSAVIPEGTETLLVVEDRDEVRQVTADMARQLGYRVLEAASPDQALDIAREEADIHLILTDIMLPRVDGYELTNLFRRIQPDAKVVFMSGHTDLPLIERILSDPAIAYLQKPFAIATLAMMLRRVLDHQ